MREGQTAAALLGYPHEGSAGISELGEDKPPVPMGSLEHLVVECEPALNEGSTADHKKSCEVYER